VTEGASGAAMEGAVTRAMPADIVEDEVVREVGGFALGADGPDESLGDDADEA